MTQGEAERLAWATSEIMRVVNLITDPDVFSDGPSKPEDMDVHWLVDGCCEACETHPSTPFTGWGVTYMTTTCLECYVAQVRRALNELLCLSEPWKRSVPGPKL